MSSLEVFLDGIKLSRNYAKTLSDLGYDDIDAFQKYDDSDLEEMRTVLKEKDVPVGHIVKLCRAVKECRLPVETQQPVASQAAQSATYSAVLQRDSQVSQPRASDTSQLNMDAQSVVDAAQARVAQAHACKV